MALDIRIYTAAGYLLQLSDSTVYGVRYAGGLGLPGKTTVYAEVWGRGHHPLVGTSYGNRTISMMIRVSGTSLDNWIVNAQQLQQALLDAQEYYSPSDGKEPGRGGARAYLSLQLAGMSNAIEYDILSGTLDSNALLNAMMTVTTAPKLVDVPLTLTVKPFGRPQQQTRVVSGTINNGGGVAAASDTYTLAAPAGQRETPVRITMAASGTADFTRMILGRKSGVNTSNFIFAFDSDPGAYTGYSVASGSIPGAAGTISTATVAAAHGGSVARITWLAAGGSSANLLTWTINDNLADFAGTYRVFSRIDTKGAALNSMKLKYGGASGDTIVSPTIASATDYANTDALFDLGTMTIPYDNRTRTSFKFTLWGKTTASGTIDVDCIYLMPSDEGYGDVQYPATGTGDQVIFDNLALEPDIWRLTASGDISIAAGTPTINGAGRFALEPGEKSLWCGLMLEAIGAAQVQNLADQFTLAFEYFPLYESLR